MKKLQPQSVIIGIIVGIVAFNMWNKMKAKKAASLTVVVPPPTVDPAV